MNETSAPGPGDRRLDDVLHGREDNFLLPLFWMKGDDRARLPERVAQVRESGCRALCVESRPHPDFCGPSWWADLDVVLAEAERLGMRVWILDDRHFPTGEANGALARHPEARRRNLVERHVDAMGPCPSGALVVPEPWRGDGPLLAVVAQRLAPGPEQRLDGDPVVLTGRVRGGLLHWDVPPGCWRVFFVRTSTRGMEGEFVDFLRPESAELLLREVYEPHWARYGAKFGSVVAGFFSDEPQLGNVLASPHLRDRNKYHYGVGEEGLALPVSDGLLARMAEALGEDPLPHLGELWYEGPRAPAVRLAYMDALTSLYRDCFGRRVGEWCRARGVEWIGHVIEDMGAHARTGYGPGHYFRAIEGQAMGGADVVLHQVRPGFAGYVHEASCLGGAVRADFFHYALPKLASSAAHQLPHMKGRAMCEVFGAYGWAEGAPTMRWLLDFLLVRGITHFSPHAFSPDFPDPDCPPHFGAGGRDPQWEGFRALMRYANRASHLLSGGRHVATAALLYPAEGEWMSGVGRAMPVEEPARALLDAHLDFDVLSLDTLLGRATVEGGRLRVLDETYGALVVPAAPHLPPALLARLAELRAQGLPVLRVGEDVALAGLAAAVRAAAGADVAIDGDFPLLRVLHVVRDGRDAFLLFNESPDRAARTVARLPARGPFARLRLLEDAAFSDRTDDGAVALDLAPGQSEILLFGAGAGLPPEPRLGRAEPLRPRFRIETADADTPDDWRPLGETDELFDVAGPDRLPDFAGRVRYAFRLDADAALAAGPAALDLGHVGETARLRVNGRDAGLRVAPPYRFRLDGLLRPGENELLVETAGTLARRLRDGLSAHLLLPPTGLLGPLSLLRPQDARVRSPD